MDINDLANWCEDHKHSNVAYVVISECDPSVVSVLDRSFGNIPYLIYDRRGEWTPGGRYHVARSLPDVTSIARHLCRPNLPTMVYGVGEMEDLAMALDIGQRTEAIQANTMRCFARQWVEEAISNLYYCVGTQCITDIRMDTRDMVGIVVGCGPSLDDVDLSPWVNRAVIVAPSQGVKCLRIRPDIICGADSSHAIAMDIDCADPDSLITTGAHATQYLWDRGSECGTLRPYPHDVRPLERWYPYMLGANGHPTGGSVTTMELCILQAIGCRTIIFVGCDFGYHDRTHAYGHPGATITIERNDEYDIDGIRTNWQLDSYRAWIESRIALFPGIEYLNASCGVPIAGARNVKLSDLGLAEKTYFLERHVYTGRKIDKGLMLAKLSSQIVQIERRLSALLSLAEVIPRHITALEDFALGYDLPMDVMSMSYLIRHPWFFPEKIPCIATLSDAQEHHVECIHALEHLLMCMGRTYMEIRNGR